MSGPGSRPPAGSAQTLRLQRLPLELALHQKKRMTDFLGKLNQINNYNIFDKMLLHMVCLIEVIYANSHLIELIVFSNFYLFS